MTQSSKQISIFAYDPTLTMNLAYVVNELFQHYLMFLQFCVFQPWKKKNRLLIFRHFTDTDNKFITIDLSDQELSQIEWNVVYCFSISVQLKCTIKRIVDTRTSFVIDPTSCMSCRWTVSLEFCSEICIFCLLWFWRVRAGVGFATRTIRSWRVRL